MADSPEDRELEIFNSALERATPAERAAYLGQACGDDLPLRAQVDELLRAHEKAGGFLANEPIGEAGVGACAADAPIREGPGTRIGRYKLLETIGEGGFGVVYMAEQEEPVRRRVALKIIKLGMDTRAVVARFEAERQALAMMDHPSIAKVHDGGATETGRPYFVMEIVRGVSITIFCDENELTMRGRIDLFVQVCLAVQHAHQKGVIHRDLKPSNILVTMHDDRPVPKVIDFGIAKATEQRLTNKTLFTRFHQFIGTPAYMSPEQTGISGLDIDTRSDIYSLGVLLYELLTGRTPFDARALRDSGYDEIQRTIREKVPPRPSTRVTSLSPDELSTTAQRRKLGGPELASVLRGDLDWIVMKCLQKDRARRYESADAVVLDLGRFLNHQPVLARPDAFSYRAGKFLRRHHTPVAFAAMIVGALIVGLIGTITQAQRAERHATAAEAQRQFAEAERRRADQSAVLALRQLSRAEAINDLNVFFISDAAPSGKPFTAVELLARAERIIDRESAGTDENRVEMLISVGRQYASMKEIARARQLLSKAYELSRNLSDRSLRAMAAAALGDTIAMAGDFDRGEQLIQDALAEIGDDPRYALHRVFCLDRGSHVARERADVKTGVERAEQAQRILNESQQGSPIRQLGVSMGLAESYRMAGRLREAAAAFGNAFDQLSALGRDDTDQAGTLLNNWGAALYGLGRPLEAERLYRRVIAIRSADGTEQNISPAVLSNYGAILTELHRFDEAIDYFDRALAKVRASGDEHGVGRVLYQSALLYVEQGDFGRLARTLDELEQRWRASMPPGFYGFSSLAMLRARCALVSNDFETAIAQADKAITLVEASTQVRQGLPLALIRRAEMNLEVRRWDEARVDAERAASAWQNSFGGEAPSSRMGHARLVLARVLSAQGKLDEARAAFASALEHLRPTVGEDHPHTRDAAQRLKEL